MGLEINSTILFRDPGIYGYRAPAILAATVIRTYTHRTGERVIVQPQGLAPRDIPVSDVRTLDPILYPGALNDVQVQIIQGHARRGQTFAALAAYNRYRHGHEV